MFPEAERGIKAGRGSPRKKSRPATAGSRRGEGPPTGGSSPRARAGGGPGGLHSPIKRNAFDKDKPSNGRRQSPKSSSLGPSLDDLKPMAEPKIYFVKGEEAVLEVTEDTYERFQMPLVIKPTVPEGGGSETNPADQPSNKHQSSAFPYPVSPTSPRQREMKIVQPTSPRSRPQVNAADGGVRAAEVEQAVGRGGRNAGYPVYKPPSPGHAEQKGGSYTRTEGEGGYGELEGVPRPVSPASPRAPPTVIQPTSPRSLPVINASDGGIRATAADMEGFQSEMKLAIQTAIQQALLGNSGTVHVGGPAPRTPEGHPARRTTAGGGGGGGTTRGGLHSGTTRGGPQSPRRGNMRGGGGGSEVDVVQLMSLVADLKNENEQLRFALVDNDSKAKQRLHRMEKALKRIGEEHKEQKIKMTDLGHAVWDNSQSQDQRFHLDLMQSETKSCCVLL